MQKKNSLYLGAGLVLFGLLNLLHNVDVIYFRPEYVVGLVFLGLGVFLLIKFRQSNQIILLICAAVAGFIGAAILMSSNRSIDDSWIGVLCLWTVSFLFAYGYFRSQTKWGLIIPAGVFFTIGLMVSVDTISWYYDDLLGGLFFLGLGLTFGFLYLIRDETNKLDWAKYPAAILVFFSGFLFMVTSDSHIANLVLPLGLISLGGYLVLQSTQKRSVRKT